MNGASLIAAERQRQTDAEGWTPEHDDTHGNCAMTQAAICYADKARVQLVDEWAAGTLRPTWPWSHGYWKPADDPVRNLVKAGALIAAEIDRLLRAANSGDAPEGVPLCCDPYEFLESDE